MPKPYLDLKASSRKPAPSRTLAVAMTLIAMLAAALCVRPAFASGPDVAHFTLGNGLEVVVIPDHRSPVVTHMVY